METRGVLNEVMITVNHYRMALVLVLTTAAWAGCSQTDSNSPAPNAAPKAEAAKPQAAETAPRGPQLAPPTNDPPELQEHAASYRAVAVPAKVPKVQFSKREEGLCKVKVGDTLPMIKLPQIGGSGTAKLADLFGKRATVVVFWKSDRRMAGEQLADVGPDVIEPFDKQGVAVVGVAVNESAANAAEALNKAGATFTNLLDADGMVFAQVGSERLPRTYVLDPSGKILWFDIEYSLTTRRELHQALLRGNRKSIRDDREHQFFSASSASSC